MPLSRRQFVARTAAAAAALPFVSPLAASAAPRRRAEFTAIRRGVGFFTDQGGTIGYLQSPDALVAVDTQFPESAQTFLDGLREGTGRGLDLLVNTHHHGDHTAGNAVLAPMAAQHVAHEAVPGLQRAAAVRSGSLDAQRYPSETYQRTWSADVGDEVVSLHYLGPAHTCGDSVIHFEQADVVHMGDLVFNRRQPYIDRGAGASVENWISLLETVHGRFSDETAFIFGHAGDDYPVMGGRAELLVMRNFLMALRDAGMELARDEALSPADRTAALEGRVLPGFEAWGPVPERVAAPIVDEFAS